MQRSELVGVRTRGAVAILVSLLVAVLFVTAQPAGASHYTNTTELSGSTNAAVAAGWSKLAFPSSATEVLLGRDDVFADSLASGSLQGSRPLLLTNSQALSAETDAELTRLRPSIVNIMGGPSAVSTAVEDDLKAKGYTVRRFSGPTRLETAIDIARRALPAATTAIVAAAFSPDPAEPTRAFADSIAAGGWAADRALPVLLTENEQLSTVTKNYLRGSVIRTVFVVGGTSAVSDAAVAELQSIGMTVRRISGPTRFDTAVRIAEERGAADASKVAEVILSEGQAANAWAAGFTAGSYSAGKDAPIVLSNGGTLPAPTATWLSPSGKAASTKLVCAAGVDGAACDAASEAMGHTPVTGSLPRLLAAAVGTTTGGVTDVTYTFSEPVAVAVAAGNFKVYSYDNIPVAASSAARDAARQDVVVAKFPQTSVSESTVAAVAHDAVKALTSNVPNAEGSAALEGEPYPRGKTRKPNLIGMEEDVAGGVGEWTVDFVFDKTVTCGAHSRYGLVTGDRGSTDILVIKGASSGNASPPPGYTDRCRVKFDVQESDLEMENIARGVMSSIETANEPADAYHLGASTAPDLESVTRVANSTTQLTYRFDQAIDSAVNVEQAASKFRVYDSRGREFSGTSAALSAPSSSGIRDVVVTFAAGVLRNVVVRGSVVERAVRGAADPLAPEPVTGLFNGPDSVPVDGTSFGSGETAAPSLTAVSRSTSGSGAAASVTIKFTYSGTVTTGSGSFYVYQDSGERLALTGCAANTTTPTQVDCTVNSSSSALYTAALSAAYGGAAYDAIRPAGQTGTTPDRWSPSPESGRTIG